MKEITLGNGMKTKVDDITFEWAKGIKWQYAGRYACRHNPENFSRKIQLHREILARESGWESLEGLEVDHINGDPLDNTRDNLRACTRLENSRNNHRKSYKGASFNDGGYQSQIRHGGKLIYIGRYSTAEEAARAYDEKAKELFGEFANLNFP